MVEGRPQNIHEEAVDEKQLVPFAEDPNTWEPGDILDIGPIDEFDEWRRKIILESIRKVILGILGKVSEAGKNFLYDVEKGLPGANFFGSTHTRDTLLEIASLKKEGLFDSDGIIGELVDGWVSGMLQSKDDFLENPNFKILKEEMVKKHSQDMDSDSFWDLVTSKIQSLVNSKESSYKKVTRYQGRYKDAFVLLTGDEGKVAKKNVGHIAGPLDKDDKLAVKYIMLRQEAYDILQAEEERGREGLVDHLLQHEYEEILHFNEPGIYGTPHTGVRDPKYLEVLKVLRKRKYFHDLVK